MKNIVFDIVTLFPELFDPFLNVLPYKRALEKGVADIKLWQLRDYAIDKYGTVDDKPYSGGKGMVLMIEPIFKALEDIKKHRGKARNSRIIVLSPKGETFTQEKAKELSKCDQITLICGRYEGIDHRVGEHLATDVISIGNYVLSGGELPALVLIESILRLVPEVLEKKALETESFEGGKLEYPQYTRPEDFKGHKVPEVLLSGNHAEIEGWREENSPRI